MRATTVCGEVEICVGLLDISHLILALINPRGITLIKKKSE